MRSRESHQRLRKLHAVFNPPELGVSSHDGSVWQSPKPGDDCLIGRLAEKATSVSGNSMLYSINHSSASAATTARPRNVESMETTVP